MKIKFFNNGILNTDDPAAETESGGGRQKFTIINLSYLFLKHFYTIHGKNNNVEWLRPHYIMLDSIEDVTEELEKEKPDIIGLGCYVWNITFQLLIAKIAKSILPNCIIVIGGPQLTAHRDEGADFFKEHPYVDYVVYGDGERPFQQIIDYHSGLDVDKSSFVNIVENVNSDRKIYPYEMLTDNEYNSSSPYVNNKQDLVDMIEYLTSRGVKKETLLVAIEFARGCMYNCAFCDWSQNLTKKVKRRSHPWKDDIDLFYELDVAIRETDANFGQWKEDLDIYNYALNLYTPTRNFKFIVFNTPKLKKNVTEYIIVNNLKHFNVPAPISLQDINETVLKAIFRPSISWKDHLELIKRIKYQVGPEKADKVFAQIIVNLPGQTFDSIVETVKTLYYSDLKNMELMRWNFLPNSPASDPEYIKLHGIKLVDTVYVREDFDTDDITEVETIDELYSKIDPKNNKFTIYEDLYETNLMSFEDTLASRFFSQYYYGFLLKKEKDVPIEKVEKLFDIIKMKAKADAKEQAAYHKELIQKYGFYVYGQYKKCIKYKKLND
jgi:radical SAM superfamily enzyme YgiQ (UPF0313 family)